MLDPQASRFWQAGLLSGLMDVEGLTACWNAISPAKRDSSEHIDRRLARQAVQTNALTLWQAQQLLAGRTSGFKVDRFVLMNLIGQGGMGRVYLARDTRLNRHVALKILAPERINNTRAIARFQREARVGAQLQHENLVRVYDFGEFNGRFFLVMEYIEGKTTGAFIQEQGPMPPATAVRLVRQIALGLEHAHRKGLIHRDVNPYNILVTHDGTAKLADLGLAIEVADEERVTREGATVGTFDYVSPEQARHSHAADIRSDIYSLGCTLYHMIAGQVPFPSPSLPEKLFGHQALEPTPLNQLVPGLPEGLIEVVRRMMRKSPDQRYATPIEVAQALEPFVDEPAGVTGRVDAARFFAQPEPQSAEIPAQVAALARAGQGNPAVPPGSRSPLVDEAPRIAAATTPSAAAVLQRFGPLSNLASAPGATTARGSYPESDTHATDTAAPLLSPVDDGDEDEEEIPLILDPGPEPSLGEYVSRLRSFFLLGSASATTRAPAGTKSDTSSLTSGDSAPMSWPAHSWFLGLILLVALVTVLVIALALLGLLGSASRGPADSSQNASARTSSSFAAGPAIPPATRDLDRGIRFLPGRQGAPLGASRLG